MRGYLARVEHSPKISAHVVEGGFVLRIGECTAAIVHHHKVIVSHISVPRGGLNAHVGGHPGCEDAAPLLCTQDDLQVRTYKAAVAMFHHDRLSGDRCDLIELGAPRTCSANFTTAAWAARQPNLRVSPFSVMRRDEDHWHTYPPSLVEKASQSPHGGLDSSHV